MEIIKHIKIEILCIIFGLFGIIIAFNNKAPEIGLGLSSTANTRNILVLVILITH